jgi:hypothetical protein
VVNDAGNNQIEISDKEGHSLLLTIDPATSLPARETFAEPGAKGTTEESFSDWQVTSGVKLPRKVSINRGGRHFADATVTNMKLNTGLTADQISKKP